MARNQGQSASANRRIPRGHLILSRYAPRRSWGRVCGDWDVSRQCL